LICLTHSLTFIRQSSGAAPSDVAQPGPAVRIRLAVASYAVDVADDFTVDLSCESKLCHFRSIRWVDMVAKAEADDFQPTAVFDHLATFEALVMFVIVSICDTGVCLLVPTTDQVPAKSNVRLRGVIFEECVNKRVIFFLNELFGIRGGPSARVDVGPHVRSKVRIYAIPICMRMHELALSHRNSVGPERPRSTAVYLLCELVIIHTFHLIRVGRMG